MKRELTAPLLELYGTAAGRSSDSFTTFALGWLRGVIACDAALWVEKVPKDPLCLEVVGHPTPLPEALAGFDARRDLRTFSGKAREAPGAAVTGAMGGGAGGRQQATGRCDPGGVVQVLGLATEDPDLALRRFFWLLRIGDDIPFEEPERRQLQALAPHLTSAQRISAFCQTMLRAPDDRPGTKQGLALTSRWGVLQHASEVFVRHIRQAFPEWVPPAPPEALVLPAGEHWRAVRQEGLVFIAEKRRGAATTLRSYPCCEGLAQLTEAEFAVAVRLVSGATYKQVAQALGLSASTVTTHVNNLYPKLGVASRAEIGRFFVR